MACGTTSQIKREIEDILMDEGLVSYQDVQHVVEHCWQDCDIADPATLKTKSNLKHIFQQLQLKGIKISICTSDSRRSTEKTLNVLNIGRYVDKLICGDDVNSIAKPSGKNVQTICQSLGVNPADAVVIGDTDVDMEMGRNGGAGMVVGVLSGIGTRLNLAPKSDVIVENVQEALPLILDDTWKDRVKQSKQAPVVSIVQCY